MYEITIYIIIHLNKLLTAKLFVVIKRDKF